MRSAQISACSLLAFLCASTLLAPGASGDFLLTSDLTDEILRYSNSGAPKGAFVTSESGGLNSPQALTWGPDGNLYVGGVGPIKKYDGTTGTYLGDTVNPGIGEIYGLAFAPDGDLLISMSRQFVRADLDDGSSIQIPFPYLPGKLLLTPDGDVLVGSADGGDLGARIQKIDLGTNQMTTFTAGGGLYGPFGLDYGPDGLLYSVNAYSFENEPGSVRIFRFDPITGASLGRWADLPARAASDLMFVEGGGLWISSVLTGELRLLDSSGQVISSVPGGSFNWDMLHMPEPGVLGLTSLVLLITGLGRDRRRPATRQSVGT